MYSSCIELNCVGNWSDQCYSVDILIGEFSCLACIKFNLLLLSIACEMEINCIFFIVVLLILLFLLFNLSHNVRLSV